MWKSVWSNSEESALMSCSLKEIGKWHPLESASQHQILTAFISTLFFNPLEIPQGLKNSWVQLPSRAETLRTQKTESQHSHKNTNKCTLFLFWIYWGTNCLMCLGLMVQIFYQQYFLLFRGCNKTYTECSETSTGCTYENRTAQWTCSHLLYSLIIISTTISINNNVIYQWPLCTDYPVG